MIGVELGAVTVDEALRAVRALGGHRYVAGRLLLVHALAFDAAGDAEALREARAWATTTLGSGQIDPASRDEALWRRSTEVEVAALLEAFWRPGPAADSSKVALASRLVDLGLGISTAGHPFDETAEDTMHPVLVDAGWELLPLAELDAERHRGAIAAFGDAFAFECARFEEDTAIPRRPALCELPALGPAELLRGASDAGELVAPLVVWVDGHETYLDYVLRGVRRAARLREDGAPEAS